MLDKNQPGKNNSESSIALVHHPKVKELGQLIKDLLPFLHSDEEVEKILHLFQWFPIETAWKVEFFLVRIFPHSDWIQRDAVYLSVFSPNAGKYGSEKSSYLDTFYAVRSSKKVRDYMVRSQLYPVNPFVLSAPFLYLLKTSLPPENIRKP